MRIQHNIMAMSAYRNYTNNVSAMKKNLEKLSSGYKINRAGDDAAGLAISEKMRAQITGLETAQKNAKDGISLVQTAEGALTEVHDMLNRMVQLATQSANGTYDNDVDRLQMQKEVDELRDEINRIADSSNFNGIKLLDGSLDSSETTKLSDPTTVEVDAIADGEVGDGTPTAGVYEIDLKDMKFTYSGTDTAASVTVTLGNLEFGGQNLISGTVTALISNGPNGGSIADFNLATNTNLVSQVTVGNNTYDVTYADGKITLTMTEPPASADDIPSGTDLEVTFTDDASTTNNNGFDTAVHVKTKPIANSTTKLAQGKFDLNLDDIKDGAKLTIGNNTYVFKVGEKGSASAGKGETLIDLSKFEAGTKELGTAAAKELSNAANDLFDVTNTYYDSANKKIEIHLTEKLSADGSNSVDYKKQWDLQGEDDDDTDGNWNANVNGDDNSGVVKFAAATTSKAQGTALTLQIGDTADDFNKLVVNIKDIHCTSLGIDESKLSIANQADAAKAIDALKSAINYVSDVRGTLGATQNRLDHTINNLSVMTENIQDAESTIRDTDVAEEMMAYTKNNILIQSAQAMLAQANQVPQGVLQLLQ